MIPDIHFGSAVRFNMYNNDGFQQIIEGVFIGFDPKHPGWGLVVPNDRPGDTISTPIDQLDLMED